MLSRIWEYLAAAGAAVLAVLGLIFLGRSWGKGSERAKQLEAENQARDVAADTAEAAVQAQGQAQAGAEAARKSSEVTAGEKKALLKKTGRVSGGTWGLLLAFLALAAGCCPARAVVEYPVIPDLQMIERPALAPWDLVVGESVNATTAGAIMENEERLKGWGLAQEAQIKAFMDFRAQYLEQARKSREGR